MHNSVIAEILSLTASFTKEEVATIDKLPMSGSSRKYFRVLFKSPKEPSLIATFNTNIPENETFINWSTHFKQLQLQVPEVYAVNKNRDLYLQEDLGNISLLDYKEKQSNIDDVLEMYRKSLQQLAKIQILGDKGLDYSIALVSPEFNKVGVLHDLLYFKFYFLDTTGVGYHRDKLMKELEELAKTFTQSRYSYFMFRDFQGRNILIKNNDVFFIDYQGGMKGPIVYDAVSLLWQAKADLSAQCRDDLFAYYLNCIENELGTPVKRAELINEFKELSLLRLLQVLGAYGYRGLFQQKQHFLISIPFALKSLAWVLKHYPLDNGYPELKRILLEITGDEGILQYELKKASKENPLIVQINSFSFIKRGYPKDTSDNGGGFVFDCRGILNPGRLDEFKSKTGRDIAVKEFLETQTKMPEFLRRVFATVDITIENYIERNFDSLVVNFGCTGGQHRSVYAADMMAKHLKDKYNVNVVVQHLEQHF